MCVLPTKFLLSRGVLYLHAECQREWNAVGASQLDFQGNEPYGGVNSLWIVLLISTIRDSTALYVLMILWCVDHNSPVRCDWLQQQGAKTISLDAQCEAQTFTNSDPSAQFAFVPFSVDVTECCRNYIIYQWRFDPGWDWLQSRAGCSLCGGIVFRDIPGTPCHSADLSLIYPWSYGDQWSLVYKFIHHICCSSQADNSCKEWVSASRASWIVAHTK